MFLNNNKKKINLLWILLLILFISSCAGVRPDILIPAQPPQPIKLKFPPRVAVVLGSGGARGFSHIGVLKVLHDAGVPIDLIVGASAGSVIGALYADSGDPNKVKNIMFNASLGDFIDIANTPSTTGIVAGYRVQKFLLKNMRAKNFKELKIPFIAATTDLDTGETYPISNGPIVPAIEASGAIPGLVQPADLYGRILVDGGVADPIPVDIAKRYQPKIIIAVNIAQELEPLNSISAYSNIFRSNLIIWLKLSKASAGGADIYIRPNVGTAGTFAFQQKNQLYAEGKEAAKKALPEILKLMKQRV